MPTLPHHRHLVSVQAYNLQNHVTGLYTRVLHTVNKTAIKTAIVGGVAMAYSMFVMFAMYGLMTWFGGLEVTSCRATFDQFFKAVMCVLFAAMGLAQAQVSPSNVLVTNTVDALQ